MERREEMAEDYADSDSEDEGEEEVVYVDDDSTSAKEDEGHCEEGCSIKENHQVPVGMDTSVDHNFPKINLGTVFYQCRAQG